MAKLSTVPNVVDLEGYAGDTLTVTINVPAGYADGMTWAAQVRAGPDASAVDATFDIVAPAVGGTTATITLPADVTEGLVSTAGRLVSPGIGARAVQLVVYNGVWDVQISQGGSDPVKTLVRGGITIEKDVTRP